MDDFLGMTIARLRERAVHCRALARRAGTEAVATEAAKMAQDYEDEAARLESASPLARQKPPETSVRQPARVADDVMWERVEKAVAALRQSEPQVGERIN